MKKRACRIAVATAVLLNAMVATTSAAQDVPAVVVTVAPGKSTRIDSPKISIWSSKGFLLGGRYAPMSTVFVTEPVDAPPGVQLTPIAVSLAEVKKLAWKSKGADELTRTDGTVSLVYLWKEAEKGWQRLYPCHFLVSGTTSVQGKVVTVEITQGDGAARSCWGISFDSIEFVR